MSYYQFTPYAGFEATHSCDLVWFNPRSSIHRIDHKKERKPQEKNILT